MVAPPSIAKAFGAAAIPLNGTTSLTFTITNPAANAVAETGVAFTDTLPAGIVVATPNGLTNTCGGTATAVAGSGSVSLTGGTIATGSNCTITANVTPSSAGTFVNTTGAVSSTNGGTGNTATANLSAATPPTITKAFGAASIPLNGSTSLTFNITNPAANTVALTGVAFTDNLPAGLVVATPNGLASTCGGTATAVAGASSLSLAGATLAADTSCTLSVNVTGTTAGVKNNSVQVTATESGAGNTSTASITVIAVDLGVTMTASPTIVAPGANLTYTITVTNNGPSDSTGYTLTDTLPSNINFVSATSGCVLEGVLTCSGPALGVGLTATYVVVVTPTAQATLTNTASVTGNEPDPVPGNNSATLQNFAETSDLAVIAAGAPSPVGGFPAFAATVTNNGPADATNVVLTDLLDNYGFVSASSTQGACTFSAPTVTCSVGALANGASAVVTVAVTAPNAGWAANTYHVSAAQPDPNPINNAFRLGPALDSFNTPVGTNVAVNTSDPADNLTAVLTFSRVTRIGSTTMASMSATSPPPGFRSGLQPTFFDSSTNAEYVGAIALNIHFVPANFRHPALVRLFHFEGGTWVDRTTGLNASSGVIAGQVMSLSPFALLEPVDTIPVANAGGDRSVPGAMAAGARVTLDGSASVDADGDPLTYRWSGPFPEGGGTVTGINPTVTLALGVSKVSLVVNDGEADSPAVAVNLAVADFQVSAPAGSVALNRGQSTTFTITMTPQYGAFGAPINLSCAPGAADVTCSFSSASVTPGAAAATATLTVTAASTVARAPGRSMPAYIALWFGTLPVFGVVFLAAGRRKKWQMAVLLMLLLVLVASHIGCGGGGTTQTQSSSQSTPGAKAITITVTGTSGTLQHSSSVTVTIPQ